MAKMCFIETFWTYYNTSYVCYDDKQILIIYTDVLLHK